MVYMLLGTGFEETEAIAPLDLLRRAGVDIQTVGINGKIIYGSHNIGVEADIELKELNRDAMEMVILPGGLRGVASIQGSREALDVVRYAYENDKYVTAICAAPTILAGLGLLEGRSATCYPGCENKMAGANMVCTAAVTDGKIITGTSAGCAVPFGLKLIEALKGREMAETIKKQIVIR